MKAMQTETTTTTANANANANARRGAKLIGTATIVEVGSEVNRTTTGTKVFVRIKVKTESGQEVVGNLYLTRRDIHHLLEDGVPQNGKELQIEGLRVHAYCYRPERVGARVFFTMERIPIETPEDIFK